MLKEQINNKCHSRKFLLGNSRIRFLKEMFGRLLNTGKEQMGDPRQRLSGMTVNGFTLIELLVVVLIIAILAAIALPQYQKAVKRSTYAGMLSVLATVVETQQLYYMIHGEYAQDMTKLDIDLPITGMCEGSFDISADVGYMVGGYCVYLTNKNTNHTGVLVGLGGNKFGLKGAAAHISGFEYLFFSTLGKRPAGRTYCREQPARVSRKDLHCTGEAINMGNYGAWWKMD